MLALHDEVHREARDWFGGLPQAPKARIMQHFGDFPKCEPDILASPNGPAWVWWELAVLPLDPRAQLALLAMTSLRERLLGIRRVLQFVKQRAGVRQWLGHVVYNRTVIMVLIGLLLPVLFQFLRGTLIEEWESSNNNTGSTPEGSF